MNQILVAEKIYVTPKLKRKKRFYKIQFVLSVLVVIILSTYYVHSEYNRRKDAAVSDEILNNIMSESSVNDNTIKNDTLVVALTDQATEIEDMDEPVVLDEFNTVYTAGSGKQYKIDCILTIPAIQITYPVISECTDELLKIGLNKFWGGEPNAVGNYCIVGHNYDGKDIFFGKLNRLQNGDIVELKDKTGKTLQYKVYNKFVVQPKDTACTSQLTNGKTEMTLITCHDGGKTRLIVKCREVN